MKNRVAIFIDGISNYNTAKVIELEFDYSKVRNVVVADDETLYRAFYFAVTADDGEFEAQAPLLDYLEYNGFSVVRIQGEISREPGTEKRKVRGSALVDLDAEAIFHSQHYDEAESCPGRHLVPLAETLQRLGKRVIILSTIRACSHDLRRQADFFIDMEAVRGALHRSKPMAAEHRRPSAGALAL